MTQVGLKKKVDITLKVHGKLDGEQMNLYIEGQDKGVKIGSIDLRGAEHKFQFTEGFGLEDFKIYQIQEEGVDNEQYVEGCDMGWC